MPKAGDLEPTLRLLTYGVYVVTTARDGREEAFLTPWVSQVTLEPPNVAIAASPETAGEGFLDQGSPFVVNILRAGQKPLAERFLHDAGAGDALRGAERATADNGCPYLAEALAILECNVEASVDLGTGRRLIVGQPTAARLLSSGQPLTLRQTGIDPL